MERWKWVKDFEGQYEVSDEGRVRSYSTGNRGLAVPHENKATRHHYGYCWVVLCQNGKRFQRLLHRLVLETFIGPCPDNMECCHYDGNKANNCLANLRWDTPRNNAKDRIRHGHDPRGEGNPNSALTEKDVVAIRAMGKAGHAHTEIAEMFPVTPSAIGKIITRKKWAHLGE